MRWIGVLTGLSAVAFVVVGIACVRSYIGPTVRFASENGKLIIWSIQLDEEVLAEKSKVYIGSEASALRDMSNSADVYHGALGFAYLRGYQWGTYHIVVVPYWAVLLATAALPARWWLVHRRACRRVDGGRCPGCGYDLRATPGRCPECGWAAAAAAATPPPSRQPA